MTSGDDRFKKFVPGKIRFVVISKSMPLHDPPPPPSSPPPPPPSSPPPPPPPPPLLFLPVRNYEKL